MIKREFWLKKIYNSWQEYSLIWLSGVRRAGKTCLAQSIENAEYFDCELPKTRRLLEDPEAFLESAKGKRVILDEIHRLSDPTELLKIGADHYPSVKILATGSSMLGASAKFRDRLTDRKADIWLTPMIDEDQEAFGDASIERRFLHGGLPPFFLSAKISHKRFQDWLDSFWAKDIQELFRLERHFSFIRFFELILANSGGMFEATRYARDCEVSRTTINNYLAVLQTTFVAHIIKPFSTNPNFEIIAAPKIYGFDTGFVCAFRGWDTLRDDDKGHLWEHYVLNAMHAFLEVKRIFYWRDKQQHEIDFILPLRSDCVTAVECKWSANKFDPRNIIAFRKTYPKGESFVLAQDVQQPYSRRFDDCAITYIGLRDFLSKVNQLSSAPPMVYR